MCEKIRPGTIVLENTTLHCWVFSDMLKCSNTTRSRTPAVRKTYQVIAKSVRVLVESTVPAERPTIPTLPAFKPANNNAQAAFKIFHVSPTKRQKML
ncbi:hypothetical protein WOLCODRAFT_138595 [Wolfiporia cocos MD-104 SS10]|uniref:Uncharacterized protein n=1 Tax=Wolfiporia cocos (strain MD-104) TaxID=742152 RepID=A0A2H3JV05_WOLCO|nr:hypothetical protein WOLCODRAFT_138595 [Wolfiporia cocos MD-104 SS10]